MYLYTCTCSHKGLVSTTCEQHYGRGLPLKAWRHCSPITRSYYSTITLILTQPPSQILMVNLDMRKENVNMYCPILVDYTGSTQSHHFHRWSVMETLVRVDAHKDQNLYRCGLLLILLSLHRQGTYCYLNMNSLASCMHACTLKRNVLF